MDNVISIDNVYTPLDRTMDLWRTKYNIPEHALAALARYKLYGYAPGGFLLAVLTNDLFEAMGCADVENRFAIYEICKLVYNELPSNSWRNYENIEAYMQMIRSEHGKDFSRT